MNFLFKLLVLTITLASFNLHAEGKKIIKWVDKNGVTQYGDRPPQPSAAKKSSVLNKQGITIQKIEQKHTTADEDKALAKKIRRDNALLASYNSIEEVEIARKRNIKIDELTLTALEQKHQALNLQLEENNKALLGYAKERETAPTEMVNAVEQNMAAIERIKRKIKAKKLIIEKINTRYERDKIRYAELESRKNKLNDIKHTNKNIAELKTWRADAQKRLDFYELENLRYRRLGKKKLPKHISDGLVSTTREVESANREIAASELANKQNKALISK